VSPLLLQPQTPPFTLSILWQLSLQQRMVSPSIFWTPTAAYAWDSLFLIIFTFIISQLWYCHWYPCLPSYNGTHLVLPWTCHQSIHQCSCEGNLCLSASIMPHPHTSSTVMDKSLDFHICNTLDHLHDIIMWPATTAGFTSGLTTCGHAWPSQPLAEPHPSSRDAKQAYHNTVQPILCHSNQKQSIAMFILLPCRIQVCNNKSFLIQQSMAYALMHGIIAILWWLSAMGNSHKLCTRTAGCFIGRGLLFFLFLQQVVVSYLDKWQNVHWVKLSHSQSTMLW